MEDELKIVLKSEDALRLDMQDQQPLELLLGNAVTYTGTTNYNELGNKPSINNVTLQGNKTASDLNLVHRGGDAMTGVLFVPNLVTKWGVEFQNQSETLTGGMYQDTENNNNQVYFDEYTGAGKRECYLLPSPTATETAFYNILTDKNPVTLAQGGTGASTADGACESIGAVKKSGDTMTGQLNIPGGSAIIGDSWPSLDIKLDANTTLASIVYRTNVNKLALQQRHPSNPSYHEQYSLPDIPNDLSQNVQYELLTSKGGNVIGNMGMPKITLIAPGIDWTSAPSAEKSADIMFMTDQDGESAGIMRVRQLTTNTEELEIGARRVIGSNTHFNTVKFCINTDGSRYITLSNASIWRNAIGMKHIKKSAAVNSEIAAGSQLYVYTNTISNYTCVSAWFENNGGNYVCIVSNPVLNNGQWITRIFNPSTSAMTAKGTMYYLFMETGSLDNS